MLVLYQSVHFSGIPTVFGHFNNYLSMALMDLCEKYFGCRSFYEILSISKDASEKEGKCLNFC